MCQREYMCVSVCMIVYVCEFEHMCEYVYVCMNVCMADHSESLMSSGPTALRYYAWR